MEKNEKRCQVIILPSKDTWGAIDYLTPDKKWSIEPKQFHHYNPHHIYITSDDEIKEGDWYYSKEFNVILQCECDYIKDINCKKIIATTDKSLTL